MGRRTATILLALCVAMGLAAAPMQLSLHELRAHDHKAGSVFAQSELTPPERVEGPFPCTDGLAFDLWACDGVDLLSYVPFEEFAGDGTLADANPIEDQEASDLWGWTDPETGVEYVIIGKTNGVAFLDVSDPTSPVHVASVENTSALQLLWFDIKVYDDHAFIVSESGAHGMLVVDLTRLRDLGGADGPELLLPDAVYPFIGSAHNLAIDEATGYAYLVGSNAGLVVQDQCRSGLHMVDISTPTLPTFAGCYLMDGGPATAAQVVGFDSPTVAGIRTTGAYVHDTQCVVYDGPDADHAGRELCLSSAEDRVVIVDVTDKVLPTTVAVLSYPDATYTHQGWLTEDHRYLLVNDELDEDAFAADDGDTRTRTIIYDLTDLDAPGEPMVHVHDHISIDHNLYTHQGLVYQSHYSAGLRISDLSRVGEGVLDEVAFFDVHPDSDVEGGDTFEVPVFAGTWSNYPYFESDIIAVSGYDGLWLLRLQDGIGEPDLPDCPPAPVDLPDRACRFGPHFQRPGPR